MKGIGNDIIELDRIRTVYNTHGDRFTSKIFTSQELAYCLKYQDPVPSLAGRFCAKEAVAKALGTGFGTMLSWREVEILHHTSGRPLVLVHKSAAVAAEKVPRLLVSISHSKLYATAVAIWVD